MDQYPRKMRRAQDSIKRNIVHIRRYRYLLGEFPTRQRLMQDVASGIYVRVHQRSTGRTFISLANTSLPIQNPHREQVYSL